MGSRVLSQVGCVALGVLVFLGTAPGSAAGGSDEAWAALAKGSIQGETVVLRPRTGGAAGGELVGLIAAPE